MITKDKNISDTKTSNKFIKFLKSFTPYQIIYLSLVVLIVIGFSVLFPDEMLEIEDDGNYTLILVCAITAVIANPICELLISKQSKWNFIVSIIFIEVTESVVLFSTHHFVTAIISLIFWIPIDLISFLNWNKHPDEKDEIITKVKKLGWKQDLIMIFGIIAFGLGVGYFLTLIPEIGAEDTYLDAFCSAVGMANGILLLTRNHEQWIAWIICLVLNAFLYIQSGAYIMLVTVFAMMVNTCYGFVKWLIYVKTHKRENTIF